MYANNFSSISYIVYRISQAKSQKHEMLYANDDIR